jgi:hypothetical protein
MNAEAEEHEIRSRKLKIPTRFVDRIVMPSEGENEEGTEGMRRMMRRERALGRSIQTTHIYDFMQQIHMRHIYEFQPTIANIYSKGVFSRFANGDADFDDRGHMLCTKTTGRPRDT